MTETSSQRYGSDNASQQEENPKTMHWQPSTPSGTRGTVELREGIPASPRRLSSYAIDASISSVSSRSMDSCTRNITLFDLIDEEFVVNCGAIHTRRDKPSPRSRRRKSILDLMDRIGTEENEGHKDASTSCMTSRSYPRGVYVIPRKENPSSVCTSFALVAAEAFIEWND